MNDATSLSVSSEKKKFLVILKKTEWLFIASYYRQLSADIKIENDSNETSFVSIEGPKSSTNKTSINFISLFVEECQQYDRINDFSV